MDSSCRHGQYDGFINVLLDVHFVASVGKNEQIFILVIVFLTELYHKFIRPKKWLVVGFICDIASHVYGSVECYRKLEQCAHFFQQYVEINGSVIKFVILKMLKERFF